MSTTLKEAWNYIETNYPFTNVYDYYVLNKDFMVALDITQRRYEISKELIQVENTFGITRAQEIVHLLYEKLDALTLPVLGYKYNLSDEVTNEVKEQLRKTKKQIKELEDKIEEMYNTICIDDEILHRKIFT